LLTILSGRSTGFAAPSAILAAGDMLWVASAAGQSVTEIDTSTGAAQTLAGPRYHFASPAALAASGPDIWVANPDTDSVTELLPR
jgi:streptogramin lyase